MFPPLLSRTNPARQIRSIESGFRDHLSAKEKGQGDGDVEIHIQHQKIDQDEH
jgi:hypothetical protein